jgi:hypothetical protein
MYQLAVETSVSPAAGLNDLPGAEATATANSDIAWFHLQICRRISGRQGAQKDSQSSDAPGALIAVGAFLAGFGGGALSRAAGALGAIFGLLAVGCRGGVAARMGGVAR